MTKELKALDKIRNHLQALYMETNTKESVGNELDIIETALKDYEELKQINIDRSKQLLELVSEQTENSEKLKALEIIKTKKGLNLDYLKNCENVEQYNKTHFIEKTLMERYAPLYHLTQEEFDLLKEVLL